MTSLVVCGGGMAGLCAAVTAAEAGAHVTVYEKGPAVGGSALMSSGFIWMHRELDAVSVAIPRGNPSLQSLVLENFEASARWLEDLGITIGQKRQILDYGHGWQVDPAELISTLRGALLARGGAIVTNSSLNGLLTDGADIVGVDVIATGRVRRHRADAVVIATGGFQGNSELVTRYCLPSVANVYHRANPWSTGDGLIAATNAGAATSAGMEAFYGHAMLAPPARLTQHDFTEVTQYQGMFSVALNLDGRRFADETVGTGEEVLNQELARQRDGRGVYVLDSRAADRYCLPPDLLSTRVVLDRALARGAAVCADSLVDLATEMQSFGINRATALATLRTYNDAMAGDAAALRPPRSRYREQITDPPFYAVAVKAAITFTMGGLAVDDEMRVLRRSTSSSPVAELITDMEQYRPDPIPHLYAAGCDVGAISNVGYMGGLATALTTGRIAGSGAACDV